MSEKSPCRKCGALILPATAERTGGLCMPCQQGTRENIERAKEYHQKLKEYNPFRELWVSLVHRVYKAEGGFAALTEAEKLYFTVRVLDGEVYNGGMHQFFGNSSGRFYSCVVDGLLELRAFACLRLLQEAKELLFGDSEVPDDRMQRRGVMKEYPEAGEKTAGWCIRLEQIDREYWKNPENLGERLDAFADAHGLVEPFEKKGE